MTPQEEQLLNSLIERVNQTQLQEKDPDAEELLNKSLGANPDAIYILAQTVLVQNIALEQAKAQVAQLQQAQAQAPQPARATSFLGSLLGHRDPAPPPQSYVPPPPPPPAYAQPQYLPPQYAPQYGPPFAPGMGGPPSFLRGAMQTAAGVAAGALAFEGVEAVLHGITGFGHPGYGMGGFGMGPGMGPGMGMMGGGFERPVEETVINNYYDQPGGHMEHGGEHHLHETASQDWNQGGAQLSDASYNTTGNDPNVYDDTGSSGDDSANYGDSGQDGGTGFDDGGGGGFDGGGDSSGGDLL